MTKDDFNAWLATMGWDRHGGRAEAAEALGVTPETIRKLALGLAPYTITLALAMRMLEQRQTMYASLAMMLRGDLRTHERNGPGPLVDTTEASIERTRRQLDDLDRQMEAIRAARVDR